MARVAVVAVGLLFSAPVSPGRAVDPELSAIATLLENGDRKGATRAVEVELEKRPEAPDLLALLFALYDYAGDKRTEALRARVPPLPPAPVPPREEAPEPGKLAYVAGTSANLRKEPLETAKLVTKLAINTPVWVTGERDDWSLVEAEPRRFIFTAAAAEAGLLAPTTRGTGKRPQGWVKSELLDGQAQRASALLRTGAAATDPRLAVACSSRAFLLAPELPGLRARLIREAFLAREFAWAVEASFRPRPAMADDPQPVAVELALLLGCRGDLTAARLTQSRNRIDAGRKDVCLASFDLREPCPPRDDRQDGYSPEREAAYQKTLRERIAAFNEGPLLTHRERASALKAQLPMGPFLKAVITADHDRVPRYWVVRTDLEPWEYDCCMEGAKATGWRAEPLDLPRLGRGERLEVWLPLTTAEGVAIGIVPAASDKQALQWVKHVRAFAIESGGPFVAGPGPDADLADAGEKPEAFELEVRVLNLDEAQQKEYELPFVVSAPRFCAACVP